MFGGGVYTVDIPDVTSDKPHSASVTGRRATHSRIRVTSLSSSAASRLRHLRQGPTPDQHQGQRLAHTGSDPRAQGRRRIQAPAPSWMRPRAPAAGAAGSGPAELDGGSEAVGGIAMAPKTDARRLHGAPPPAGTKRAELGRMAQGDAGARHRHALHRHDVAYAQLRPDDR